MNKILKKATYALKEKSRREIQAIHRYTGRLPPMGVACAICLALGFSEKCDRCSGVGVMSIPFTEFDNDRT